MSRLDELIQEYCPDGVPYFHISDFSSVLRGKRLTKSELLPNGKYAVYHGGLDPLGYYDESNRTGNTVMIINVGASAGTVGFSKEAFWSSDGCYCINHSTRIIDKYLYYYLMTQENYIKSRVRFAGIPTLDAKVIDSLKIPVPPLPVQSEIVRILDNFTELTAELQAKLQAELTARKKQYEYYADNMFPSFKDGNMEWIELGSVATVTKLAGFEFTKYVTYSERGEIIALRGLNVKNGHLALDDVKYIDGSNLEMLTRSKLHIGDMLFTYVGTVGQVALIDKEDKYYLAPNVALVRINDTNFIPKYMMYYFLTNRFKSEQIAKLLQASSMQNIPMEKIRKFKLPKISLERQQQVIDMLDRFDVLCNDISSGLPAEIEARQKQYEYYRDKLLIFKEAI